MYVINNVSQLRSGDLPHFGWSSHRGQPRDSTPSSRTLVVRKGTGKMDEKRKGSRAFNAPEYFETKRRTESRHDAAFVGGRSEEANRTCPHSQAERRDDELDEAFSPAGLTILVVILAGFLLGMLLRYLGVFSG